jgi:hypothetical protein
MDQMSYQPRNPGLCCCGTAVNGHHRAGDISSTVREEEGNHIGYVLRFSRRGVVRICNTHFWKYNDFGKEFEFVNRSRAVADFDMQG